MSIIKTEHLVHNYIIKTSTMDINTIHVLKDIAKRAHPVRLDLRQYQLQ